MRLGTYGNWNVHTAYSYNLITGPATTPISLVEVKDFLRLDTADTLEDAFLTLLIEAAVDFVEKYTGREMINKTFKTYRQSFNESTEVRRSKLQSITSINYYDSTEALVTVSGAVYAHTDASDYSRIYVQANQSWPSTGLSGRLNPVEITFVAGYGPSAADVPAALRRGMLEHVLYLYENRGDCGGCSHDGASIPGNVKLIYNQYKIVNINGNEMV